MPPISKTPLVKDAEIVAAFFSVFNAPWIVPATLYIEGPSMAMGAGAITSYYVFDGSWESFVLAWLAGGTVYAILAEKNMERAFIQLAFDAWNGIFDEIDKIL